MEKHISREHVKHLSWLARLELSEEEEVLYTSQLNEILEYFNKLSKLNTENVPPTYHVIGKINVFREDEIQPSLSNQEALKNAPKKRNGFFEAPKIL
ncbi:Asp-tRNA(Asn)/Glu-tRNA(Gln) amidotransferase GatCAB subunit C [Candidatus Bathyarchaeota archaeon]|nr:MAG: Asp-tRNA(Asn)/Glu-tRNA(Gln) amidotransferase GatCAB subunit C [Candidatus Bathyarchaeota archaeon]